MDKKKYEIVTNTRGHRILVVNSLLYIEKEKELDYHSFDSIFVNFSDISFPMNMAVIWKVWPVFFPKCWLKPIFLSGRLKNRVGHYGEIVDGFAHDPQSETMAQKIADILAGIRQSGISTEMRPLHTTEDVFIALCQFYLSRGKRFFTSSTVHHYASGYTLQLSLLFGETFFGNQHIRFQQKLLNMGHIRQTRFIDRLHYCPHCYSSHLLFAESCPKCRSSNIREEAVLHHFRCANVSPESTYAYDGQLRCPKCRHFLRHIGVDYDRPASVYTCQDCNETFMTPKMKVVCGDCGKTWNPEELFPYNVVEYEFTGSGIQAFTLGNVEVNLDRDQYVGYTEYDHFLQDLIVFAISGAPGGENAFYLLRLRVVDATQTPLDREMCTPFFRVLFLRLADCKISFDGNYMYILQITQSADIEEVRKRVSMIVEEEMDFFLENSNEADSYSMKEYSYRRGEDIHAFIRELNDAGL